MLKMGNSEEGFTTNKHELGSMCFITTVISLHRWSGVISGIKTELLQVDDFLVEKSFTSVVGNQEINTRLNRLALIIGAVPDRIEVINAGRGTEFFDSSSL